MRPEKLQAALTERQREAGLYLEEPDDETLQLKRDDKVLASFSQRGATVESIREEAERWLEGGLMEQDRGIRIPLKRESWELIVKALTYMVEKPHLDDLGVLLIVLKEEERVQLGDVLRYIERKLEMG